MLCPYPGKCEYDDFRRVGVHYCAHARYMYPEEVKAQLKAKIKGLTDLKTLTPKQATQLKTYRKWLHAINS